MGYFEKVDAGNERREAIPEAERCVECGGRGGYADYRDACEPGFWADCSDCKGSGRAPTLIANDVDWMPKPNRIEEFLTDWTVPPELCTSAFVFAFDEGGRVLVANVRKRGLDVVGGHVEPVDKASPAATARREAREETGAEIDGLVQVGFHRLHVASPTPGYRYPTPHSYQVFFAARLVRLGAVEMTAECGEPRLLSQDEALAEPAICRHEALYRAAREKLFGNTHDCARQVDTSSPGFA